MPLHPEAEKAIKKLITEEFFKGGPKLGTTAVVSVSEKRDEITFSPSESYKSYYTPKKPSALYWRATVQVTWATSVQRRGIACIDGYPILFAEKLHTARYETFRVVALKRGSGFTATAIHGFVFRLGDSITFDEDRKRGQRRFLKLVRNKTAAVLNGDIFKV